MGYMQLYVYCIYIYIKIDKHLLIQLLLTHVQIWHRIILGINTLENTEDAILSLQLLHCCGHHHVCGF